jgi:hypothetical protein
MAAPELFVGLAAASPPIGMNVLNHTKQPNAPLPSMPFQSESENPFQLTKPELLINQHLLHLNNTYRRGKGKAGTLTKTTKLSVLPTVGQHSNSHIEKLDNGKYLMLPPDVSLVQTINAAKHGYKRRDNGLNNQGKALLDKYSFFHFL